MKCRHCASPLTLRLVDLGSAPPSNAYLTREQLQAPEKTYPLKVMVCEDCWLAQTQDFAEADELFASDYAYFTSYSDGALLHAERYVIDMIQRFQLGPDSHVVEVGSNDGYLLQYVHSRGLKCTGIEPTASTAAAARAKGIETIEAFFGAALGSRLAAEGLQADLVAANNVLAHVPDINGFVQGFEPLLKPHGVATFEFPHLSRLIAGNQFDTIYHEHFSYLSLTTTQRICSANGLAVFDVEELPTHGGSLRVYAQKSTTGTRQVTANVRTILARESEEGVQSAGYYAGFQAKAERVKDDFLHFLIESRRQGKRVGAYGAAAKGNTLMNFAGCRGDLVAYVVDRNPVKRGNFMPGSRIPIVGEEILRDDKPDYVLILPWNLKAEVMQQLDFARAWGAKFVTAIPGLEIAS